MINKIKKELNNLKDKRRAEISKKYFKTGKGEYGEGDLFLGIDMKSQRDIVKKYYKGISLKEVENLLSYNIHEYRVVGLLLLVEKYKKEDKKKIFNFYLKNKKGINNWDLVDITAPKIVGDFLFDKDKSILYKLANSKNLWEKRIAIISTLFFISKGEIEDSLKISKILLKDKHDLIHKAVGWTLREVGKKDKKSLIKFLDENYKDLNRTTLRYAIEKFEEKERQAWLKKDKEENKKSKKGSVSILLSFIISLNLVFTPIIIEINEKINNNKVKQGEINSIYLTGWSSSSSKKINETIKFIKETEINAVVIDIKDYSGYIFYKTNVEDVKKYNAEKIIIRDIEGLVKKFKEEGIYTIARIVIFQDPVLSNARPDLAIKSKSNFNNLWLDRSKLSWVDPASKEVWEYNLKIIKDAFSRGFDEVNLDYIRFPSDGNLKDMTFPFYNESVSRREVIKNFSKYIRENTKGKVISADIFGLVTVNSDDMGIGQVLEDFVLYFDYICPMVYPSHYANGFIGYKNPAEYPYEVINYSMERAKKRIDNFYNNYLENNSVNIFKKGELRPWLQDFNMGAIYDKGMIKKQIDATKNALNEDYNGYMLWNPRNVYTK